MKCAEFSELAGYQQGDEMEAATLMAFHQHRDNCAECASLFEATLALDESLRRELLDETPDPAALLGRVRTRIQQDTRAPLRWLPIAAAALLTLGAGAAWRITRPMNNPLISAAVRDHNLEVKANSPRRWRLSIPAMQSLLEQYEVGWSDVQALLPVGFILERAKECKIDGQPALHLVFTDGSRAVSVFFRGATEMPVTPQVAVDGTEAAGFRRGKLYGLVVTSGAPGLCAEAVRRLTSM